MKLKQKTYAVPYRRKRQGRTNYRKRLTLLISKKPRLVIRPSLNHIAMYIISFKPQGDFISAAANSRELKSLDWKFHAASIPAAYLTGMLVAKKALKAGIKEAVLDIGFKSPTKGAVLFAALKGAVDGGLTIPHSGEVFPDEKRIRGEHIAAYAALLQKEPPKYQKQFSACIKSGTNPAELPKHFDAVKAKIAKVK